MSAECLNTHISQKKLDIMQGDTDGYFRPYDNVTRAELITMLDRIIAK